MSEEFDVVIVGAGLAGLATAQGLGARRVLVLEERDRVGGRVWTVDAPGGVRVDMGACFAYNPGVLPEGVSAPTAPALAERGPLGIALGKRLVFGADAAQCIAALELAQAENDSIAAFQRGEHDASSLKGTSLRIVERLLQQIHPGDVRDYSKERQRDVFIPWYPDHHATGNGATVRAHYERLGASTEVRTSCTVSALHEDTSGVEVTYHRAGGEQLLKAYARGCVIATPATIAATLLPAHAEASLAFVRSIRYATYTVVALVLDAPMLADFRYIVTPDLDLTLVMQQASADRRYRTLLCYYAGDSAVAAAQLSDDALIDRTCCDLETLTTVAFKRDAIVFQRCQRWPVAGTVLDEPLARAARSAFARATERIWLAGDYVSPGGWGYGMDDAVASGLATAKQLQASPLLR